ncbi:MAG: ABC transporter ATP-binding protein [Lachnospira sp.]|nr:ABC transporter ATP-binding protein [Lachnospira sp.]
MIELQNLEKVYGQTEDNKVIALDNINLAIKSGDFVAVMGESGSGKTTLLNILGAMDDCTSGSYLFNEMHVEKMNRNEKADFRREHIGFVFQNFALLNNYSVYENVNMPMLLKKLPKKERKDRVIQAIEKVGIADLRKKSPTQLSGGQQQRCAIARAIVMGNNLILADEPTGALDSKTSEDIMKVFQMLNGEGKTIVMVTHDSNIASYAHSIIRIKDGRI